MMSKTDSAPFSYEGLDRVFHEKARLGLLTSLMAHPKGLAFADLKQLCGLTDGNLSRHLAVLQEAGLVELTKGYEGNRPHTSCRLTKSGRRRFLEAAPTQGIGTLTLYAFSTDNWRRPKAEVAALMTLLRFYLANEVQSLVKNGVRLSVIGRRDRLPDGIANAIARAEHSTAH